MDHLNAMSIALDEARSAVEHDDIPVGSVILDKAGAIVGRGHNRREVDADPTAHAEIIAMRQAATHAGTWRLDDHTLVVTLEPCAMCAGAIVNARIRSLVFGTPDLKAGAAWSLYNIPGDARLNHQAEIIGGVRADECSRLLVDFFAARRTSQDRH